MPSARLTFAPAARHDLRTLGLYIAEHDPDAARRVLRHIQEAAERLTTMPLMGRARPELGQGYRSLPVGRIVIFYRPTKGGIEVLRVADGARSIEKLFGTRP